MCNRLSALKHTDVFWQNYPRIQLRHSTFTALDYWFACVLQPSRDTLSCSCGGFALAELYPFITVPALPKAFCFGDRNICLQSSISLPPTTITLFSKESWLLLVEGNWQTSGTKSQVCSLLWPAASGSPLRAAGRKGAICLQVNG